MKARKRTGKFLILLLLLLLVIPAVLLSVFLEAGKKGTGFTEETAAGSLHAAEGLTAYRTYTYGDRVSWTSEIAFGGESFAVRTESSLLGGEELKEESSTIDFRCHDVVRSNQKLLEETREKAVKEGEAELRCRDYLKYYEPSGVLSGKETREFFKVPVPEEAALIYEYDEEYDQVGEGTIGLEGFSLKEIEACGSIFFYLPYNGTFDWLMGQTYDEIEEKNGFRELMDNSEIPGGYGLYEYDGEHFHNIYSPERSGRLEGICEADDHTLLITTCEEGSIYVVLFDVRKKAALQKMKIGTGRIPSDCQINDYSAQTSVLRKADDVFFLLTYDRIAVLEMKDGRLEKVLDYRVEDAFNIYLSERTAIAYDGQKAAIAGLPVRGWEGELWNYGFSLAVIGRDGLLYSGVFKGAMDEEVSSRRNIPAYECYPENFIELHWNEKA